MYRDAVVLLFLLLLLATFSKMPTFAQEPINSEDQSVIEQSQGLTEEEQMNSGAGLPGLETEAQPVQEENIDNEVNDETLVESVPIQNIETFERIETEETRDTTSMNQGLTNMRLKLNLPTELSGFAISHTDETGETLSESFIDASGKSEVELKSNEVNPTITINSESIRPLGKVQQEESYDKGDLIVYVVVSSAILFAVGFWLGRRSGVKLLESLRDYIYEEDLD